VEYGPSEHEIISEEEHLIRQKAYKESRKKSFVGTPEYMAPEVVNNNPERGYAADLWALGVMIYQLATGKLPFKDNSDYLTFLKTLEGKFDIPADLDKNVIDIITRLLVANPSQRLGAGGKFEELRTHPYFEGVEWQKMTGDEDLPEKVTELILLHKQALHKQKGGVGGSDDDNDGRNEEGAYKGKTREEMDVIEMLDHEFDAQARTIETVKEQTGYMLT
jgi:serine/threonine protein kinase